MTVAILEKLTGIFRNIFDDDSLTLRPEMSAADVDGWDSLTHIRLMLSVERAFSIKLTASEIGKLRTVGDLLALVERKTA